MLLIILLASLVLAANPGMVYSQVNQPIALSELFSQIPGTPRIAANEANKQWLVVWRQGVPGMIKGRILQQNGVPGPAKVLLNGISSSSQSLDVALDTLNARYLLAFESVRGLEVQLFDQALNKQGTSILIKSGISGSNVRALFDQNANRFVLIWRGSQNGGTANSLNVVLLNPSGSAVIQPRTVAAARPGNRFGNFDVARNPKNRMLIVMMVELTSNLQGSVVAYMMKPDGTLLTPNRAVFQAFTPSLNTIPQASFTPSGKGFALWSDANLLKTRSISESGIAGASTITVSTAAGPISRQPAIAFDPKGADLVTMWAEGKQIKRARLNPNTGAVTDRLDVAASLLDGTPHAVLSFNAAAGNILAVWEDASLDNISRFRIRAGLLGAGKEVLISGASYSFTPERVTIPAGTTVRWINSTGDSRISVTSGVKTDPASIGLLFNKVLMPGASFSYQFTQVGSFPYFCKIDPSGMMKGVVTVIP